MNLSDLLACPSCGHAPLQLSANGHRCPGCRRAFPSLDGVPWLFPEPGAALGEWRLRLDLLLKKLEHEGKRLGEALTEQGLRSGTRARLEALQAAHANHAQRLRSLLSPLSIERSTASYETHLALRTRLPSDQGLTTYYANVHRDWAWGSEENEASFRLLDEALGSAPPGVTAVLGAGAGRLAYDIHVRRHPDLTLALDFNPLLVLLAHRICRGETVELYEFPIAPRRARDTAVLRRLAADAPAGDALVFVLGDALHPPFKPQIFDTIITPWLIDILPVRFEALAASVNGWLRPGARWINFGSLSFHHPQASACYALEECEQILGEAGFGAIEIMEADIPYMCSPASRHGRRETVVVWRAQKIREVSAPRAHPALPDWIVTGKEPIPLLPVFQMQALSTRIYAFIMSLIDGRRSLEDIAALMEDQRLMKREEAKPAIRSFLIKMYEESRRSSSY